MRFLLSRHPSADALNAFANATASTERQRVAHHLADCASCRAAVQRLRDIRAMLSDEQLPEAPESLRERMLSSRAEGQRVILPVHDASMARPRRWGPMAAAAALIAVALLAEGLLSPTHEIDAGATSGTLIIVPAMPRAGETIALSYQAPASLAHAARLTVRARLRTANSDAYEAGAFVRTLGIAKRDRDGTYRATLRLPDSVVFAALVLEDSSGSVIDDNDQRAWEVLTTSDGTRPMFAALYQRTNDMMGRSFEDGQATASKMVAQYPDSIGGWSYLHAFEIWMGAGTIDSTLVKHRAALAAADRRWRASATIPANVGRLTWYARTVDTATARYWHDRMMREARSDGFALQFRLYEGLASLEKQHDTAAVFALLDSLWNERTPDRGLQIAGESLTLAVNSGRRDLINQWRARMQSVTRDTIVAEISFAEQLSRSKLLSDVGIARLRAVLPHLETPDPGVRLLTETPLRLAARYEQRRRRVFAALGRALVVRGATRAGIDTLKLAASTGWDLSVIRTIRSASFIAGDSTTAWEMTARIAADPSVSDAERDSLSAAAVRTLGAERWGALHRSGSQQFSARMMDGSKMQSLVGNPRVRDASGALHAISALGANRVTVVAFWSRFCGWALDDLSALMETAKRLEKAGARMIVVMDGETGPSRELTAFMEEKRMRVPVYFDVDHTTLRAFNNWGTPHYYVLDAGGRLRFGAVTSAAGAMARAEAVRLAP